MCVFVGDRDKGGYVCVFSWGTEHEVLNFLIGLFILGL